MKNLPAFNVGGQLIALVETLEGYLQWAIGLSIAIVVALLAIRLLADLFRLNPFGKLHQYAHQPTNEIIFRMRSSSFYYPLKKSLGFDPAVIMVLIAMAILWYVLFGVFNNFFTVLRCLGTSIGNFSNGYVFNGSRYLIASVLLAVLFFIMALMTLVFVNWIFGLLRRPALWAMDRLSPLLHLFEFGGIFAGWSFVILWIALNFATFAVMTIFL